MAEQASSVQTAAPQSASSTADTTDALPELDAGKTDNDSTYGSTNGSDGGTSVTSSILQGYTENGRKYQVTRENNFNVPSDEKQFSSMFAKHLCFRVLESLQDNPHFRSPISKNAQHIIDLGTGDGAWALDVADMFPNITVHGTDLYPPPTDWVARNCILEVDDMTKTWTWPFRFDLVHIRFLFGAFSRDDWKEVYRRAYENLEPGGWIEHVEVDIDFRSNDNVKPAPEDSLLANFGPTLHKCAEKTGNATDITDWMREEIEAAGFTNVHERQLKMPVGDWPAHPIYKEAGRLANMHMKSGLEGWCMWLLTKYGSPTPWSPEEVAVYCAKLRNELDQGYHIYQFHRRCWAQKPYGDVKAERQTVVEKAAPSGA